MGLGTQILILIILLVLSGFFSGIETALMSVSRIKIESLLRQKKRGSKTLQKIKSDPDKLIITILIGNNLANISAASLATVIFTNLFGSSGIGIATGIMTFLILIFGEITPKTLAAEHAVPISLFVAKPIQILEFILTPIVKIFSLITRGISKLFGSKKQILISESELTTTISLGLQAGIINKDAAKMMHNIMEFENLKVNEIMTPEANIKLIDGEKKLKETLNYIIKTPFSRYPVYSKTKDEIVGIIDVDDVLKHLKNKSINIKTKKIAKPAFFIPESKQIDSLLLEFQEKKNPMAIVVDEYGHLSGIVTVEDILEEIVGDIFNKGQRKSAFIKQVKKNTLIASGKTSIEEINKRLDLNLKEKNFNTLTGLIEHKLQKIPKKGEILKLKKITIKIQKVTKQGIQSVKVYKE